MKKFIFFARVYIWCTLAIPLPLYAQDLSDVYPNYVVIGAFAIQNNAVEFTEEANKNKFPAKFEMNYNRNLYYVYVRTTDDRKFAFAEALRLRKETKYFDTWVYSGPFAKVPLAEQSTKEYRDFDPRTGEGVAAVNTSGAEKNTSETISPLANGDERMTTSLTVDATLNETSEGLKNRRQEKSARRTRKDVGAIDTETLNGQNVGLRSPANEEKNPNSIAYNDGSNGVATVQPAERNPAGAPEADAQRTGAQANQASAQIASKRTDGEQAEISSLATSANDKQDSVKTAKNNKGVGDNTPGAKPKQSSTHVAKQGGVNGQNTSLTPVAKQTESSGTLSKSSPETDQVGPQHSGEAMKQTTATGARTGKVLTQSSKDNSKASGQNGVQSGDQPVEQKSKSGPMAEQTLASKQNTGSLQASQQSRSQTGPASDAQTSTATAGVKDLSPEELLKISSLTDAGKKALAENRERVVKLGPPPQRTTTAQLSKDEVSGKNFYFYLFRADNLATVDGEVDAIDFEKSRRMATYQGNVPVKVIMPSGKTKQISFVCEVFGYRKQQKEFDPASPPADLYLDDKGNLVVPFELRRMQKGDIAIMYNVFFFKDAAVMRPESRYEVNNLLDLLVENPTYKVMIHGHTNGNATGKIIRMDTPGNFYTLTGTKQGFGSAKQLSEERAIVIREFLVNSGISPERMQIKAWGGKKPIHDKHSVRANENVRVEIEILSE